MTAPLRVLELFCGIGGFAPVIGNRADVAAAVDIDQDAPAVYRHNFCHPTFVKTIESLPTCFFREWDADLWCMSPPCQPYTHRGKQADVADPRAASRGQPGILSIAI